MKAITKRFNLIVIIFSLAMAILMLSISSFAVGGVPPYFNDINGHWAFDVLVKAFEKEIIFGYDDGSFRPDSYVTRAETVAILNRFYELKTSANVKFFDVQSNDWYYNDISIAIGNDYIKGNTDGTFKPDDFILRLHTITMIYRILGSPQVNDMNAYQPFPDAPEVLDNNLEEYVKAVVCLIEHGVLEGYEDGLLRLNQNITRAELVKILFKLQDLIDIGVPLGPPATPTLTPSSGIPTPSPTATPTVTPGSGSTGSGGGGGSGGSGATPTPTPSPVVYKVGMMIQETTPDGARGEVGPVSINYIASSSSLQNVYSQLILKAYKNDDDPNDFWKTFADPWANRIMLEGINAYSSSLISGGTEWIEYVTKYINDVEVATMYRDINIKIALRDSWTMAEIGYGSWSMIYSVEQIGKTDGNGNPIFRQYTVTITIDRS